MTPSTEYRPSPMTMQEWRENDEALHLDVEQLADSDDPRARDAAQRARFMRERRPKGT
jgi:hypothetical protein